jgi:hypothetical protein
MWRRCVETAVFLSYLAALGAGMAHHVLWRDEWATWLIVRDSHGLGELFHNIRYEGHPALYYLLLYAVKPVLSGVRALQTVQAMAAAASVAMLLWASPFTLAERALLPFGTYVLYEYGIKSRSYVLGTLILWGLCVLWRRPTRAPVAIGATLALLANVHVLFAIVACAAFAAMAMQEITGRIGGRAEMRAPGWQYALGAGLFGVGVTAAIATALPPADMVFPPADLPHGIVRAVGVLCAAGAVLGTMAPVAALPSLAILIVCVATLRRHREAQAFLALAAAGLLLFFGVVYFPNTQHIGVLFCVLIAAAWIARRADAGSSSWAPIGPRLLVPVLAVQGIVGLALLRISFEQPYSNSFAVAAYIRSAGWAGQTIAALSDYKAQSVVGYLDAASIFYVPGHRQGSFVVWDAARQGSHATLMPGDLPATCPLTLIADAELPAANALDFGLTRVASFDSAQTDENYVLYRSVCR